MCGAWACRDGRSSGPTVNVRPDQADHPARVLIVDDEPHNRQLLEVMLAPEGYQFQTAVNGEEALVLVAQHPPDLILLDVMMPGLNGYEVATAIKDSLATARKPGCVGYPPAPRIF